METLLHNGFWYFCFISTRPGRGRTHRRPVAPRPKDVHILSDAVDRFPVKVAQRAGVSFLYRHMGVGAKLLQVAEHLYTAHGFAPDAQEDRPENDPLLLQIVQDLPLQDRRDMHHLLLAAVAHSAPAGAHQFCCHLPDRLHQHARDGKQLDNKVQPMLPLCAGSAQEA